MSIPTRFSLRCSLFFQEFFPAMRKQSQFTFKGFEFFSQRRNACWLVFVN